MRATSDRAATERATHDSPGLYLRLLGSFEARHRGVPLDALDSPRQRSLLTYLVVHRDAPQDRGDIAYRFWPDSSDHQARTNLRQLLHHLRRGLPDADRFVHVDQHHLQWRPEAPADVDLVDVEEGWEGASRATARDTERVLLQRSVDRYGGVLLPGAYEDWVIEHRARLSRAHADALDRLAQLAEEAGEAVTAIAHLEQLLDTDALREDAYRRLMDLHRARGEQARALRVYHRCATTLAQELGVDPSPETRRLHAALLDTSDAADIDVQPALTEIGRSPFVGRQPDWQAALGSWNAAAQGRPHALVVTGEPGIGKTRLVEELARVAQRRGATVATARAYAAEGRLAYGPVGDWLRTPAVRRHVDAQARGTRQVLARLLPELGEEAPTPSRSRPEEARSQLFRALGHTLTSLPPPVLLVIDDLPWCDADTLGFLHYLLRERADARLLVAATARDGDVADVQPLLAALGRDERLKRLELGPLDPRHVAELAEQLRDGPLSPSALERLVDETSGSPLFVVELLRAGWAPSHDPGAAPLLPPRVQATIEARLEQLSGTALELAEVASVLGRGFRVPVLRQVTGRPDDQLVRDLDDLWQRRILREIDVDAYDFSHDRIRDVALARVGPARRRELHRRIANALEALHTDDLGSVSSRIAVHHQRGAAPLRAIDAYRRAADHARRLVANDRASELLGRALDLIGQLPPGPRRDELELEVRTARGVPLVATHGYGAAEVRAEYQMALDACRRLGRPPSAPVLRGLALAAIASCQLTASEDVGRQLLDHAQEHEAEDLAVEAHYVLGVTAFWRGRFSRSADHLCQAVSSSSRAGREQGRRHVDLYAQDPEIVCLSRLALTRWYQGQVGEADRLTAAALELASSVDDPISAAYAVTYAAWLAIELGDVAAVDAFAQRGAALWDAKQLGFFRPMTDVLGGWLVAEQGDPETGSRRLRTAIERFGATGQTLHLTWVQGLLARALSRAGRTVEAATVVDSALTATRRTGQRYLEPELRRLQAVMLPAGTSTPDPARALDRAVRVAAELGAISLQLRAATTWARLVPSPDAVAALRSALGRLGAGARGTDVDDARSALDVGR